MGKSYAKFHSKIQRNKLATSILLNLKPYETFLVGFRVTTSKNIEIAAQKFADKLAKILHSSEFLNQTRLGNHPGML